jgi:uncharacterized membrane protein YqhA
MSKIDFTGLKLKLLSSIVAISAIQLLRLCGYSGHIRNLPRFVVIRLPFVVSDRVNGGHVSAEGDKA